MRRILVGISVLLLVGWSMNCFALDKFLNYKHTTSATRSDENTPVVPEVNYALKQGYVNTYTLTATTNKTITVPTGSKFALFAADADIWVRVGAVAAIPSGDTTNGTGSELNPSIRYLDTNTTIGVISTSAAKLSVMFYK